jgi:hypothetical protein
VDDLRERGGERWPEPAGALAGLDEIPPGQDGLGESLEYEPVDERAGGLHQAGRER